MLGSAKMADGKDVIIMTVQAWDTYCYEFNEMNGIQQPQGLLDNMRLYHNQEIQRQDQIQKEKDLIEYQNSWQGINKKMLWKWYMWFVLPLFLMLFLYEDITNAESTRKFFWKHKFSIPDL